MLIDLLVHGPASRADLARRAGLSPASLTRITRSLVDVDPVTESDAAFPQRTGRPSQPMDVNVDLAHLVGIKLSATQLNLVTTGLRARWFGAAAGCRDFVLVTIGSESVAASSSMTDSWTGRATAADRSATCRSASGVRCASADTEDAMRSYLSSTSIVGQVVHRARPGGALRGGAGDDRRR